VTTLEATEERIAAAKRAQTRDWTFGPEGPTELSQHPVLGEMVMLGLIEPHYVTADQWVSGLNDHFLLTELGEQWLAEHTEEQP
jgi:hypothetical protein